MTDAPEVRITRNEIDLEMDRLLPALPASVAYALALGTILSRHGVRYRHRTIIAREPPELLPPYECWRDPCTMDWVIRQGPAA